MLRRVVIGWLACGLVACADGAQDALVVSLSRVHPARSGGEDVGFPDGSSVDLGEVPETAAPDDSPDDAGPDDAGPTLPGPDDGADGLDGAPVSTNAGYIGAACEDVSGCDYDAAVCLGAGWPNGHCSLACDRTCPDRSGLARTFCAPADSLPGGEPGGLCLQRCDFGQSPTGCRAGYTCQTRSRFNEPAVTASVCVPGDGPPAFSGCVAELVARGVDFELASNPMESPDGGDEICDVLDPVRISGTVADVPFRGGSLDGPARDLFVTCEAALAIHDTASIAKAMGIRAFSHLGTYNCRYISGTRTMSQHAFANAIDLAGVETEDGARYTLIDHWERGVEAPVTPGGQLLKRLAEELHARRVWNIILTPEFNQAHWDHFHVDRTEGAHTLR